MLIGRGEFRIAIRCPFLHTLNYLPNQLLLGNLLVYLLQLDCYLSLKLFAT